MKYTLWFYDGNGNRRYDVFTGTRYQCYKLRHTKTFSLQYRVFKCTW